jgi:hypothetical protein
MWFERPQLFITVDIRMTVTGAALRAAERGERAATDHVRRFTR